MPYMDKAIADNHLYGTTSIVEDLRIALWSVIEILDRVVIIAGMRVSYAVELKVHFCTHTHYHVCTLCHRVS